VGGRWQENTAHPNGTVVSFLWLALALTASPAVDPRAESVTRKLDIIQSGKAKPGRVPPFILQRVEIGGLLLMLTT
jgi:hypothetical protein